MCVFPIPGGPRLRPRAWLRAGPDFAAAASHLGAWEQTSAITFGRDGTPFYVQGPHDNPSATIRTLTRSVGEGNFHYPLGGPVGTTR
jgi:hypothetical protein